MASTSEAKKKEIATRKLLGRRHPRSEPYRARFAPLFRLARRSNGVGADHPTRDTPGT